MSSLNLFSLKNQNVVVTGATRGIGAVCAVALAQAGASVCLIQRMPLDGTPPNLDTLNTIRALGATAHVVYCDLSDLVAVKHLFQNALDVMGGEISVLVNCAGIQRRSPSLEFSESDWDDVCAFIHFLQILFLYSSANKRSLSSSGFLFSFLSFRSRRLPVVLGPQRQPQIYLVAVTRSGPTYGSPPSWQNYQLLLSLDLSRWHDRPGLRRCKGCFGSAH
jgi:NAD(P)-dependent dehydrogenase (short-subunit alcohol dehydrogenase family)